MPLTGFETNEVATLWLDVDEWMMLHVEQKADT
jgi:hypothetical protein